ncbi:polysaccharide deacetylase family protein [Candidatus Foliamicus sp.]
MALDPDYLKYPLRRYGMDHDRYEWSMLSRRTGVAWPDGARLAVWVDLAVQFFPLNQSGKPFAAPGGMSTPYPDLRHFTLRDYGNRVGLFRCLEALDAAGITPTFSVNAALAERCPQLLERLNRRGNEILASSWHMDTLHHGGMAPDQEAELIGRSLETLRAAVDSPVTGWLSPGRSQSGNTPDLLAAEGIRYMGDWINDDMPYPFATRHGELVALPLSLELDDQFVIGSNLHSEWEYADQVKDACDYLLAEAESTGHGRLLALSVHPWMMGQPHRIAALESVLAHIAGQSGIWSAPAGEIVAAWSAQQPAPAVTSPAR